MERDNAHQPASPGGGMTCQQAIALLEDDDTRPQHDALQAAWVTHLNSCADCTSVVSSYRRITRLIWLLRHEGPSAEMTERVWRQLSRQIKK